MARGFGAKEGGFRASTGPRWFNYDQLDKEMESIPENRQEDAMRFYEKEFKYAEAERRVFENNLSAAQAALKNPNFDWANINEVSFVVPLSKEMDEKYEGDYQAFLEEKWDDYASTSEAVADAETKDREYEDDEGIPASERGNSEVEYLKGEFFKDLIGGLIDDRDKSRKSWENEINAKTIIDKYRERNLPN